MENFLLSFDYRKNNSKMAIPPPPPGPPGPPPPPIGNLKLGAPAFGKNLTFPIFLVE